MVAVTKAEIEEQRFLVESGDLDLTERKEIFQQYANRETTLLDEGMLVACAKTDDDDEDLFVKNVTQVEDEGYIVVDEPKTAA